MKKLKAFWLRRSVATRLTALMALMLVLVCAVDVVCMDKGSERSIQ